ncbi:hypothetical protein QTG56_25930 (plasmid) [Rossellomorea sp. AcN35-11]|nr:hypothetical protein [Rossellomorea aquimaris]WJV32057.1 hypothetical protein QTG56_25930 [Rossellomorea sp. AcN35-11]
MLDFLKVIVQYGSVGAIHGFLGGISLVMFTKYRSMFWARGIQGAVSGYIAALAGSSIFDYFGISLSVTAVVGFSAGFIGLSFPYAIGKKIAEKWGLDLPGAQKDIDDAMKRIEGAAREKEIKEVKTPRSLTHSELEKIEQSFSGRVDEIEKRVKEIENDKKR